MKRSSKIFALVLSLALILGALAIATFAAADDVTVVKSANFNGLDVGTSNTASDGKNPGYNGVTFQQGGRAGKVEVVEGSDGNKYMLITQTDKKSSSGPYASLGTGGNASVADGVLTKGSNDISNYKFQSFEIDVMSPTGKFITGTIDIGGRRIPKGGTARDFWNTDATSSIVKFGNDDKGSYIYAGFDANVKKYINPYEFTNIQIIVENITTAESTNIEIQSHVFVNGELWFTKVASNVTTSYCNDDPHAAFIEVRVNYLASDDNSMTMAIDNLAWKTVPAGSETAVADILAYDADNRPAGMVVATVDDVDYYTLEGAIEAADEGSTLEVLVDKYTPTTVDKKITIVTENKYLNLVAADGYTVLSGNGVYKVKVGGAAGITIKKTDDMQSISGGGDATALGGTKHGWTLGGRRGTTSVGSTQDGNKFAVYTQTGTGTGSGYLGTGYGAGGTTFAGARPTVSGGVYSKLDTNNEYLVFDVDLMSPTGAFPGINVNLELRGFKAGDATIDVLNTTCQQGLYITDNAVKKAGVAEKEIALNPYEFTHFTVIYDKVVKDGYVTVDSYLYVNGEFFGYTAGADIAGGKGAAFYEGGIPHLVWEEIRINFPSADDPTKSVAIDNATTRLISSDYNGNLATVLATQADLDAWESSIYDADFMPVGLAVAQIGEVEYYDFAAAVEAAGEEDEIELLRNIPGAYVIDKAITVVANGFTVDLVGDDGFAVKEEDGKYIVFDVSDLGTVDIYWDYADICDACVNGEFCNTEHVLANEEYAISAYTKFADLYNPTFVGTLADGKIYKLAGWEKVDFDFDNWVVNSTTKIDEDAFVTEADLELGYVILMPVFEEVTNLAFEYVKGGETVYAETGAKLADVITAADAGSTIKFLADYKDETIVNVGKAITLDLNGKIYDATQTGTKAGSCIKVNANGNLTITSSAIGAKIFGGATASGGSPFITTGASSVTIKFIGKNAEGKTSLSVFVPTLVQAWSNNNINFSIDGGEYYRIRQDNSGFIQLQGSSTTVVKNALLYDFGGEMFHFPGRSVAEADAINTTLVVDNCVIVSKGTVMSYTFEDMSATFTNCYIDGAFGEAVYSGETAGKITLGAGNYLTKDITTANIAFVEGYNAYDIIMPTKTIVVAYNTFKVTDGAVDPSTFVVNEYTHNINVIKVVSDKAPVLATVTWKAADGTVLGTSKVLPGTTATVPSNLKTFGVAVEGWLGYIPAEWETSLEVPADVTEYEIIAKEGGAVTLGANVDLLFNIRLTTHFEYIMYVPEIAEGIEVIGVELRTDRLARYNSLLATKYVINGKNYTKVDGWPGLSTAATENSVCGITFKYGEEIYTVSTVMNIPKYVDYVLDNIDPDGVTGYTEDAAVLVANVANYVYEGCKYLGNTAAADKVADVVANNTARLISIPDAEKVVLDTTAISEYISGVSLYIEAYGPRFRFTLTEAGKALDIKITEGYSNTGIVHADTDTVAERQTKGYIETTNTHVTYLNKTCVKVIPAEGEAVSITWTLGNYYAALEAKGATAALPLVNAMYGYAIAGARY